MKIPNRKKKARRTLFNKGKGELCPKCGALLVTVLTLTGEYKGEACPIGHT